MKQDTIFLCFILCFLSINITAQHTSNRIKTLSDKNLKGKVKSVREIAYKAVIEDGELFKGGQTTYMISKRYYENNLYWEFDKAGRMLGQIDLTWTNSLDQKEIYEIDTITGRLLNQYHIGFFRQGITRFIYNDDGQVIEERSYDKDDTLYSVSFFTYDELGYEILEEDQFYGFMADTSYYRSGYDHETGQLVIKNNDYGNRTSIQKFANNQEIGLIEYNEDGDTTKYETYEYDANNNRSKMISYEHGKVTYYKKYTYDHYNNKTKTQGYNPQDEPTLSWRIEYVYDEQGNWVQQVYYRYDQPITIVERQLVYFD